MEAEKLKINWCYLYFGLYMRVYQGFKLSHYCFIFSSMQAKHTKN